MAQFKILIIDDGVKRDSRKHYYTAALGTVFEIKFVETPNQLYNTIDTFTPDIYLIDVVLKSWNDPKTKQELKLKSVLDYINLNKSNIPIALVSSKYSDLTEMVNPDNITKLFNYIAKEKINVVEFWSWNEFETFNTTDYSNAIADRLYISIMFFNERKSVTDISDNLKTIGVVCALEEELKPFLSNIDNESIEIINVGNFNITTGVILNKNKEKIKFYCLLQRGMGMVDCAFAISFLVNNYKINHLFMIGVCGGNKDLNIKHGDIIIPSHAFSYQNGKIKNGEIIPQSTVASCNSPILSNNQSTVIEEFLSHLMIKYNEHKVKENREYLALKAPNVYYDSMACGDYVIDSSEFLRNLSKEYNERKLYAVEMESYAIFRTSQHYPNVKCSVIKSVMDLSDGTKDDRYKEYACFLAGNLLYYFLYENIYPMEEI